MDYFVIFLKGIAIGIANAIPGVSGGTIAVVTKIFDKMMGALTLNIKKLVKNMPFLIPLGLGMAVGIIAAAKLLTYLLTEHVVPTQLFFLGVVIGSIPLIYKECTKEKSLKPVDIVPILAGIGVMVIVALFADESNSGLYTSLNLKTAFGIVFSTFIAGVAMIIPGVSGSTMLKALGYHSMAMQAINDFDIPLLMLFAAGAFLGIFTIAKILSTLLEKFRKQTYCVIIGLIIGSLPSIYPQEFAFNLKGIIGIVLFILGLFLPSLMELPQKLINKNYPKTSSEEAKQ